MLNVADTEDGCELITITGRAAATLTVTDLVIEPPGPVAVAVNVFVSTNPVNVVDPLKEVTPKFELRLVALLVLHVNVVDPPFSIDVEEADKLRVGGDGSPTATFAFAVALPAELDAVIVYV